MNQTSLKIDQFSDGDFYGYIFMYIVFIGTKIRYVKMPPEILFYVIFPIQLAGERHILGKSIVMRFPAQLCIL